MAPPILSLPVKVLRSATAGRRPGDGTFRALTDGELFVNTQDKVLCYLNAAGSLVTYPLDPAVLAALAPLASPAFTGTPTVPSPAAGDNSQAVAPTSWVQSLLSAFKTALFGSTAPAADGAASAGTATTAARADHVHPTDASRAPLASPAFTGTPSTASTPAAGDNSTNLATTAYADGAVGTEKSRALAAEGLLAPKSSPAFTGTPTTAATPAAGDNSMKLATTAYADRATATAQAGLADGGCYLGYSSTTSCLLTPKNGGGLLVNGVLCSIPTAGISLSNSGLAASTLYYVYATASGGAVSALVASTTGYVADASGRSYMSNGAQTPAPVLTSRLVGKVYTNASSQFENDATIFGVLSYFQRQSRATSIGVSASTTSAGAYAQMGGKISFLAWPDEAVRFGFQGYFYSTSGNTAQYSFTLDGPVAGQPSQGYSAVANAQVPYTPTLPVYVSDGAIHSTYMVGQLTTAGTTNLAGLLYVETRG